MPGRVPAGRRRVNAVQLANNILQTINELRRRLEEPPNMTNIISCGNQYFVQVNGIWYERTVQQGLYPPLT